MRVLSIDLDYCMDSCLDLIDNHKLNPWLDENPILKWRVLEEFTPIPDKSVFIDDDKVDYCWDIFTKALKHCDSVMFGYDHDAILYRLEMDDAYDLEIINIDYHADLLNANPYADAIEVFGNDDMEMLSYEYDTFQDGRVMEGNWVGWLDWKGKVKDYTWIHGIRSLGGPDDGSTGRFSENYHELFSSNLNYHLKENFTFDDYNVRKPFENSVPSLEKIDELCAEYPALKIAYDKFRNVWRICYNDYVSKNPDEENY